MSRRGRRDWPACLHGESRGGSGDELCQQDKLKVQAGADPHGVALLNVQLKVDAAVGGAGDSEVALAEESVPALAATHAYSLRQTLT